VRKAAVTFGCWILIESSASLKRKCRRLAFASYERTRIFFVVVARLTDSGFFWFADSGSGTLTFEPSSGWERGIARGARPSY
jgi:hypothetical protein